MRDALKNLVSNQLILEYISVFYYTVQPYEFLNALGNMITTFGYTTAV
ncbi:MAG: hypothetical protein JWR61_5745 [Ferruginibacter sp.]|nr:hypothetical protein [Ferruginibacter sp.]